MPKDEIDQIERKTREAVVRCAHRIETLDGVKIRHDVIPLVQSQIETAVHQVCLLVLAEFQKVTEPITRSRDDA